MADNVAITAGSGTTIAADDVGGVLYQRVKIAAGADGSATDVSSAAPLPVNIGQIAGANILTGAGTAASAIRIAFPTDQTLTATMTGTVAISGTPAVTVSSGTIAATQSGTYTVQPGNTPNTSAWLVDINGGTVNAGRGFVTSTATTAATIIATPGTGVGWFVHSMQIGNTSGTQAVITLNDTVSTQLIVPANGGNNPQFNPPLTVAANTALTFTTAPAVTSILAAAQAHKA